LIGASTPEKEREMQLDQAVAIYETTRSSFTAERTFPEIVARLAEAGVERYHTDYSRGEKTLYFTSGESVVIAIPIESTGIAREFSAAGVESAVRQSQRNEHTYADFLRKTMEAGCVGYFVLIAGKRALYFGRNGEVHTEWFPGTHSAPDAAARPKM